MSIPTGPYAALKIRDFRFFVSARFCVTLAIQIQSVVVAFQVYTMTHDPFSLGLIGLSEALPSIAVSLYAGHVADVLERKKIIVACVSTLLFCSACLLLFTVDLGEHLLNNGVFPIYSVIFISGIARGFLSPAIFSFMPQLVPRDLYTNAVTWNSTLWETASITGLALGGFLFAIGVKTAYSVDVALMLAGLVLILLVHKKPVPPATGEEGVREKIKAGLRFVFDNKIILSAISLDLFAVLFGGAVALLPIFADEILHVGSVGLGFLRAAPSTGALLMAFFITHNPIQKNVGKKLFLAVAGYAISMIMFALSRNFWLSLSILVVSGAFDCVSVIIRATLLQTLTPENMKGRVSAVNNIFIGSSNEIGMFYSGTSARIFGAIRAVIIGGCMSLAVVGVTAWASKSLRRLQKLH